MCANTSTSTETATEIMRESSTNDSDLIRAGGATVNHVFVVFAVVTMSIAIVCNMIVFIVTAKTTKLHCISNALVSSLAVADFARAAACVPLSIALQVSTAPPGGFDTTFGMCSIYQTLFASLGFVSTLSLAIISVERAFMIARPLVYQRVVTNQRAAVSIATLWLAGFTYGWLQMMSVDEPALSLPSIQEQVWCNHVPTLELGSVDFVLTFLAPLTMMATAYAKIFMIVQSQMRRIDSTISGTIPSCWYSRSSCHKDSVGNRLSGVQLHGAIPRNIETCGKAVAGKHRSNSDTYNQTRGDKTTSSQPEASHNDTQQRTMEMHRTVFRVGTLTQDESTGEGSRHPTNTEHAANDLPLADVARLARQLAPAVQVTFFDGNATKITNDTKLYSNCSNSPKVPPNSTAYIGDAHRSMSQQFGTIALKRSSIADDEQYIRAIPRLSRRSAACSRRSTIAVATLTCRHRSSISQLLDNKATKMVAIVIGTFLLCWMPYKVVNLMASLCDACVDDRSLTAVHMITYVSSAVNPFIYSFYSGEFRKAFRRVMWKRATRRVTPQ